MKSFQEFAGKPLTWVQTKGEHRSYELQADDEVIGHLEFKKSFGSLATGEVLGRKWTFKREGFLHPRVNVRNAGSEVNLTVFRANWSGGGALQFVGGKTIQWHCTNFWGSEWAFLGEDGRAILRFKLELGWVKASARLLEINHAVDGTVDLALLMAVGWYLMVLTAEDMAAASAVVVAG